MKCAVAIVLALIGMSLAHPAPSGLGGLAYSPLLLPSAVEYRSSVINHGVTLPRVTPIIKPIILTPIKPIIEPIIKTQIITPVIKSYWGGLGYGLH
ncbi:uncharacterized protein LOC124540137 [Vanessa cardui]|uniref:uncharacterized protein LOC124540137 n=1 Tax=Vanessa cardui TaxID=171605 RepID=UPI000E77A44A|nr:uncharacterized protein LOC113399539 [Vanessa tameamea]XP_046973539.1 uncharacterized protein LOC124540137 [Vanessa cardui]